MGIIKVRRFEDEKESITKSKLNELNAALVTEFNGHIDNDNIKENALIASSKINLLNIDQDVTISGALVSSESTTSACLVLTNTGDGPHISMTGNPVVINPQSGDLWFDGTNLKMKIGINTYNIDMTAE